MFSLGILASHFFLNTVRAPTSFGNRWNETDLQEGEVLPQPTLSNVDPHKHRLTYTLHPWTSLLGNKPHLQWYFLFGQPGTTQFACKGILCRTKRFRHNIICGSWPTFPAHAQRPFWWIRAIVWALYILKTRIHPIDAKGNLGSMFSTNSLQMYETMLIHTFAGNTSHACSQRNFTFWKY